MDLSKALRQLQRLNALLAIAQRKAASGLLAFSSLSNHQAQVNGAPIAPAATVTFTGNAMTARVSGKILVFGGIYVQSSAVDDAIGFTLVRNPGGGEVTVGPGAAQDAGHVNLDCSAMLGWIDSVVKGTSNAYGIRAHNNTGGHTVTVPAPAEAFVIQIELPG